MVCAHVALRALVCISFHRNAGSAYSASAFLASVSTFSELQRVFEEGATSIVAVGSDDIVFSQPLELHGTALSVEGQVGTTALSGDGSIILFTVDGGGKLSLRGVALAYCGNSNK